MTAATMNTSRTGPAARASAHTPSSISGSTTSWTQRGTTIRSRPVAGLGAAASVLGSGALRDSSCSGASPIDAERSDRLSAR